MIKRFVCATIPGSRSSRESRRASLPHPAKLLAVCLHSHVLACPISDKGTLDRILSRYTGFTDHGGAAHKIQKMALRQVFHGNDDNPQCIASFKEIFEAQGHTVEHTLIKGTDFQKELMNQAKNEHQKGKADNRRKNGKGKRVSNATTTAAAAPMPEDGSFPADAIWERMQAMVDPAKMHLDTVTVHYTHGKNLLGSNYVKNILTTDACTWGEQGSMILLNCIGADRKTHTLSVCVSVRNEGGGAVDHILSFNEGTLRRELVNGAHVGPRQRHPRGL